jgi:hypothetical protein
MPGKIGVEALEGDATEVHGFAASLFDRALPEWDLESGVWGFYPTFMFVAYPVFFSLALLGDSEAAVRLPSLLFLAILIVSTADLAARGRTRAAAGSLNVLIPMLVVGYLSMQVGAYYAGYHPFHGDLACSPLEEWMVTGLATCALLLVRDGAPVLAAIAAALSLLTFPSGLMVVGLFGLAGLVFSDERRRIVKWGIALAAIVAGWAAFLVAYTLAQGTFGAMLGEWWTKYFEGRASFGAESPGRILRALGWYVLLAGGVPVAGYVVAAVRGDRMARWLAAAGAAWVAFFLLSPNKNIHYFFPVAFLPMAAALRTTAVTSGPGARRSLGFAAALTLSGIVCIALCRPAPVPPYTADREFGRATIFLAGSERQAVEYSRVLFNVADPLWRWRPGSPWTIGHHTWVMYADRGFEMEKDYDFYVGEGPRGAGRDPGVEGEDLSAPERPQPVQLRHGRSGSALSRKPPLKGPRPSETPTSPAARRGRWPAREWVIPPSGIRVYPCGPGDLGVASRFRCPSAGPGERRHSSGMTDSFASRPSRTPRFFHSRTRPVLRSPRKASMTKRLYVGNLPFSTTPDQLRDLFAPHGEVVSVTLIEDRDSGRPRGFGFVEMDDTGADRAVQALDETDFGGRQLRVNFAKPRPDGARSESRDW